MANKVKTKRVVFSLAISCVITLLGVVTLLKPVFYSQTYDDLELIVTATGKNSRQSFSNEIRIESILYNGKTEVELSSLANQSDEWNMNGDLLCAYKVSEPASISILLKNITKVEVNMIGQRGSGIVEIKVGDTHETIDLYRNSDWVPIQWVYELDKKFTSLNRWDLFVEIWLLLFLLIFLIQSKVKLTKEINEKDYKQWIVTNLAISLFVAFTTVFSICIQSYFGAVTDFWFSVKDFIFPLGITFIGVSIFLFLLCMIPAQALHRLISPLIFGLGFCAYLQVNFLNKDYGLLDGHEIIWSQYGNYAFTNLVIWIVVIVALIIMFYKFEIMKKTLTYASLLLIIMQISGMVSSVFTAPKNDHEVTYTQEGINEVGDGKNLLILILDSFDVEHMNYLVNTNDSACDIFEGFTYYNNAVSPYPKTQTAVPYMISGLLYKNEQPYDDFLKTHFPQSKLLNRLSESKYNIGVYLAENEGINYIADKTNNIKAVKKSATSEWSLFKTLMNYCLFRELPHGFKKYFPVNIADFNRLAARDNLTENAYVADDASYYQTLVKSGLSVLSDTNTFRMIHLNGMHEPLRLDSNANYIDSSNVWDQMQGMMLIVKTYLDALHETNTYNNTAIMILGDHGAILGNQPALLFKPINSHGNLVISDNAVHYEDIHKTLLNEVGMDVDYGYNMAMITDKTRERIYYSYRINDQAKKGYYPDMWEAIYLENNAVPHFTGKVYKAGFCVEAKETAPRVELSQKIVGDKMRPYFNSNFLSWGADDYIWTMGREAIMAFNLENIPPQGVMVTLHFISWIDSPEKPLRVYASDDTLLFNDVYTTSKPPQFQFHVPAECFDKDNSVMLRMEWDDDSGILTDTSSDLRKKQIGLVSFVIE